MATISRAGRWLMVALAALGLLRGALASAQTEVAVQALTIELWPEYDQPSVLVILRATLDPAVPLPAIVTLHLPAAVTGPSAVAAQDPSGQLLNTPYTVTAAGENIAVELQTAHASFQVEYYDTSLAVTGEERAYRYAWQADFPVGAATLHVQEPAGARNLTTTPPVSLSGASSLGLNYYSASLGPLSIGQTVTVDLRYAKSGAALSVEAAAPGMPFALIAVVISGLIVLAALAFGAGRRLRSRARARSRARGKSTRARRTRPPAGPPVAESTPAAFCTQCGQPASATDRFCRNCGAPRR